MSEFKLKKDQYSRSRGGISELLDLSCTTCQTYILTYQKDGPGKLLRLYLDRIHQRNEAIPAERGSSKNDISDLVCPSCEELLGIPMIYKPESRLAYRLIRGKIKKEKSGEK